MFVTRTAPADRPTYTDSPDSALTCEWFALCDQPATLIVRHPILGTVPTCQSCADKLGLMSA